MIVANFGVHDGDIGCKVWLKAAAADRQAAVAAEGPQQQSQVFFSNLSKSKLCSANEYGQQWYFLWIRRLRCGWKLLQTCAAEKQLLHQSRLLPLQTRLNAHTHKSGQSSMTFLLGNFEYTQPTSKDFLNDLNWTI